MEFAKEQIETIEKLAGIGYSIRQIAMYFNISAVLLYNEYEDKNSEFTFYYDRGKLIANADVDMKVLELAKSGTESQISIFKKSIEKQELDNLKNELFGL